MKKLKAIFLNPFLAVSLFLIGAVCCVIASFNKSACYSFPVRNFSPENAEDYAFSQDGLIAVNEYTDENSFLVCADLNSHEMRYMLGRNELSGYCGIASRKNIIFGENGELFLHYVNWSENMESAIDKEYIARILPDGTPQDILCGFSYENATDPPTRTERLSAFRCRGNLLEFAYTDTEKTELYSVDTLTGTQTCTAVFEADENHFVCRVFPLEEDFLLVYSDGEVYRSSSQELVYQSIVDLEEPFITDIIQQAVELNHSLYVTTGYYPDAVYLLEDEELTEILCLEEFENQDKITKLYTNGNAFMVCTPSKVYSWQNGTASELDINFPILPEHFFPPMLSMIGKIFLCLGILALMPLLFHARKKLIVKQFMLMFPAIGAVSLVVIFQTRYLLFTTYYDTMTDGMLASCEITARMLDGDDFNQVDPDDAEAYLQARETLLKCLRNNRGYWEGAYDFKLCLPCSEGVAFIYIDTASEPVPFGDATLECDPEELENFQVAYTDSLYYSTFDRVRFFDKKVTKCTIITPIKNSNHEITAYLMMTTDSYDLNSNNEYYTNQLIKLLVILSCLLLVVTTVISLFLLSTIKKTITTVNEISHGNFSARVEKAPNDELGDICRQVNSMAGSLEAMFREKDENERFYYKFVPEKFRELLGKEKLTELSLGDATSREFTVLFCDIRSFSLNSEMLTASENFEFVNIIYGIAGPIVRKYGGFVDKYIGDAVMALFESADSAVSAGMELYKAIVLDPQTAEKLNVSEINIGVGIHTGMARIGIVGEEERLSGTVISNTVNLSSRLESLTKTYQTAMLISKDTLDKMHSSENLHMRWLGMVQVAGVNEVKSLYEVLDCLDEERKKIRTENAPDFREAVRLFHLGKRQEACSIFQKIQQEEKADNTVSMYLKYIQTLSDEEKSNIFRFVRK